MPSIIYPFLEHITPSLAACFTRLFRRTIRPGVNAWPNNPAGKAAEAACHRRLHVVRYDVAITTSLYEPRIGMTQSCVSVFLKQSTKLVPYAPGIGDRVLGQHAGKIWMADDFNTPLPEALQQYFEWKDTKERC